MSDCLHSGSDDGSAGDAGGVALTGVDVMQSCNGGEIFSGVLGEESVWSS